MRPNIPRQFGKLRARNNIPTSLGSPTFKAQPSIACLHFQEEDIAPEPLQPRHLQPAPLPHLRPGKSGGGGDVLAPPPHQTEAAQIVRGDPGTGGSGPPKATPLPAGGFAAAGSPSGNEPTPSEGSQTVAEAANFNSHQEGSPRSFA